jgi:hypothetical protein
MFVKLNFSADTSFQTVRQIINGIINDQSITNIPSLVTAASSWDSGIVATLDYSTSEIIRTVNPTTVKSHFADESASTTQGMLGVWTLEFQAYDAPSRKYYISFNNAVTASDTPSRDTSSITVGDTILSGSMDTDQASMSVDLNVSANVSGTPVRLSSTAPAQLLTSAHYSSASPNNYTNIRTFWMYLTNDCLIVASTHGISSNLGFNATYSGSDTYSGPWIFSQYQRYDYHNTNANGVIPLIFTNISRATKGAGFGALTSGIADWARAENVNITAQTGTAFRVFNCIDAHPQVGTSWPLISFPSVNWGSGSRLTDIGALNAKSAAETILDDPLFGQTIFSSSQIRYPSSDLRTLGYGMLPLRWANSYRFNQGGNASTRGGFYIFNGDYFPGDTFIHGGKTYMVWPTWAGYTDRVGIAVPKE